MVRARAHAEATSARVVYEKPPRDLFLFKRELPQLSIRHHRATFVSFPALAAFRVGAKYIIGTHRTPPEQETGDGQEGRGAGMQAIGFFF